MGVLIEKSFRVRINREMVINCHLKEFVVIDS